MSKCTITTFVVS